MPRWNVFSVVSSRWQIASPKSSLCMWIIAFFEAEDMYKIMKWNVAGELLCVWMYNKRWKSRNPNSTDGKQIPPFRRGEYQSHWFSRDHLQLNLLNAPALNLAVSEINQCDQSRSYLLIRTERIQIIFIVEQINFIHWVGCNTEGALTTILQITL